MKTFLLTALVLLGCSSSSQNADSSGSCYAADGSASIASDPELDFALTQLAAQYAPAATAMGTPLTGNFRAGQQLETQVQLLSGGCYTAVAAGNDSVTEVNVRFLAVTPIPGSAEVLATDQDTGRDAVLGKDPDCYKNAFPMTIPVKMVLEVADGCGDAAAQVYER